MSSSPQPYPQQESSLLEEDDSALLRGPEDRETSGFSDQNYDGLTLKQTASLACKHIDIGTAIMPKPLFQADVEDFGGKESLSDAANTMNSTHYGRIVEQEFNAVVIEHHLKWAPLCVSEPGPLPDATPSERLGRYDFYYADAMVDWCQNHNIRKIKGHVLVWHVTSPKFLEDLSPNLVREHVKRHIFTVMGHFRGRIQCWDVVNESLAPNGALAENVFYRKLGPSYIEDCFRWAHEADPDAILLYNDNKVEGIGSRKAEAFYDLLADLKAKNVPVHGCGMQAHFNAAGTGANRPPTPHQVKMQIKRLGELGLKVNLSEMDVRISKLPDAARKDEAQRQIYHDILAAALTEPAFDGIWLWGFTDRHTWVHNFYYDDEPCIFDESYQRKDAYYAVRSALATLTPGNTVGGQGVLLHANKDDNGLAWGHEWMIPEEPGADAGGDEIESYANDARPDWEMKDSQDEIEDDDDDDNDDESGEGDASDGNDELLMVSRENLPPIS